jgi:hypothetical protein
LLLLIVIHRFQGCQEQRDARPQSPTLRFSAKRRIHLRARLLFWPIGDPYDAAVWCWLVFSRIRKLINKLAGETGRNDSYIPKESKIHSRNEQFVRTSDAQNGKRYPDRAIADFYLRPSPKIEKFFDSQLSINNMQKT